MTNNIDIAKKSIELFCKKDWKAYRDCFSDDTVFEEEATGQRFEGADKGLENAKMWATAFPDMQCNVKDTVASGDAVVLEIEWLGTHKGEINSPMGRIAATNKKAKVPAVMVIRLENGKVTESRHYWDLMTLFRQLGIAPQQAAQPRP